MFGAICGDILGSSYEFQPCKTDRPDELDLFRPSSALTDDTVLSLAVADWLLHDGVERLDAQTAKDRLAARFLLHVRKYADRSIGYGGRFSRWIDVYGRTGEHPPYQSFGNGSAMRVSPTAWYFGTLEQVLYYARLQADVTHDHPEGERGAQAVACAVFLARMGKTKGEIRSEVTERFGYPLDRTAAQLRAVCRFDPTCQGSVPHALTAFLESRSYEEAIRLSIAYGGDSDTIACMAGGIAEAFYGPVPAQLRAFCADRLDPEALALCQAIHPIA